MENLGDLKKVIWAVSVFKDEEKNQFTVFKTLTKLLGKRSVEIEPVSVLSPEQLRIPSSAFKGKSHDYRLEVEKVLSKWVQRLKDPRILEPTFLLQDSYSTRATVETLLKHARSSGAGLIALGTHHRKGIDRLLLGSVAETMMMHSEIPLFIVDAKKGGPTKISRILFPTDFSPSSENVFKKLLPTAQNLKARVVLYFKLEYMVPQTGELMAFGPDYHQYLEEDVEGKKAVAKKWAEVANAAGVKTEVVIDEKPGFVPEAILKFSKKTKADMIALASHSGPIAAIAIGSIARQMVRTCHLPVWVIHPK